MNEIDQQAISEAVRDAVQQTVADLLSGIPQEVILDAIREGARLAVLEHEREEMSK